MSTKTTSTFIKIFLAVLFIVYLLRKLYRQVLSTQNYNMVNAMYVRKIGFTVFLYTIADFVVKLVLNLIITYNSYVANSDNVHVGTRIFPDFQFQLFVFGLIILVISDIYMRVTEIQDDLKLTI